MKNWYQLIIVLVLVVACGGSDDPPPEPEAALLVFPDQNSECTTGISLNETLSQVTFEWQASANTDQYTLRILNLDTNTPQSITTQVPMAALSIEKGAPFSWSVTSLNQQSGISVTSDTWLFYNAGPQTNYAPFPAQILSPESGSSIVASASNEVVLRWSGADVENDIVSYEIYFSDQNPPQNLLTTINAPAAETSTAVTADTTYYWRIETIDAEGNRSDSGIFDFRVR